MEDEHNGSSVPGWLVPVGVLVAIAIVAKIFKSRKNAKDDRAFAGIFNAIEKSDLPDKVKDMLLEGVDEVRGAVDTVREKAVEMRGH